MVHFFPGFKNVFFLTNFDKKMDIETVFLLLFYSSSVVDRRGTNYLDGKLESLDFRTTFEKMILQGSLVI